MVCCDRRPTPQDFIYFEQGQNLHHFNLSKYAHHNRLLFAPRAKLLVDFLIMEFGKERLAYLLGQRQALERSEVRISPEKRLTLGLFSARFEVIGRLPSY